jgi:hypothetical protein
MLGLKNLYNTISDLFSLPQRLSLGIPAFVIHEALSLSQRAHVELRMGQALRAIRIARIVSRLIDDITRHPGDYIAFSRQTGLSLGAGAGGWLNDEFFKRSSPEIGHALGSFVGQVEFEVVSEILFQIGTEGVGNVAHALAAGHFARGGGRVAGLIGHLRPIVRNTNGVQRLARSVAVEAEISRAVEAAFAEGATFESGVMRVIRVRETGISLTAEQLAQWRKLRAGNGLPSEFARLWNDCSNRIATENLTEIRRLWSQGDAASKLEARRLARLTFDNWRNRFMGKLRAPANAGLRAQFERVGFRLTGGRTTSPRIVSGEAVTLDHVRRLMEDPLRCVDPSNLEFVIGYENSVTLEQLRNLTSVDMF